MVFLNFGGVEEEVVTRDEFPLSRAKETFKGKTISVIGYGSQGPGQSQNLRDQGFNVIVGQRQGGKTYQKALDDGWEEGKTLFTPEEAAKRGDLVALLVSDAGAPEVWHDIKQYVHGKSLYVSHGFPIHFHELTGITPYPNTDVIMVAPKGAGLSVRKNFLNGSGINASFAIHNNASGSALEKTLAMAVGIGAGYMFPTTMEKEVVSDHVGERAILLAELKALAEASYESLARGGLGREKTFELSSEQLTQVILPLIGKGGSAEIYMQAMQAGELSTVLKYQNAVREAVTPVMKRLYKSAASGVEAKIALDSNSKEGYREKLNKELAAIDSMDIWKAGKAVREKAKDRTYSGKIVNFALAGAVIGAMEAQYQTLIDNRHSPSEAFNETVEETTQSLNQFYQEKGVSYLLGVCSTTAQRGALDWAPKFKDVLLPLFMKGPKESETARSVPLNYTVTTPNIWDVALTGRYLRPENLRR